jgi:ABC-2 type transport system ATP-binding protein
VTAEFAIETRGLGRRYGERVAVAGLDLCVPRGACLALLGTNGAGKTTTVRLLTGIVPPTAGDAWICGYSIRAAPLEVKRRIGVVPDPLALFTTLSFWEHLTLVGRIHGLDAEITAERGRDLLELLELDSERALRPQEASAGTRKKLALAMALLPRPPVLFLDEPFESLDPFIGRTLRDLLVALSQRGVTIVLTSHLLEVVERIADHVAILAGGRLVFSGTMAELHAGGHSVEDAFRTAAGRSAGGLPPMPWLY